MAKLVLRGAHVHRFLTDGGDLLGLRVRVQLRLLQQPPVPACSQATRTTVANKLRAFFHKNV